MPGTGYEQPKEVIQEGLRLDGRGFEEFRPVCESLVCSTGIQTIQSDMRHRGAAMQFSTQDPAAKQLAQLMLNSTKPKSWQLCKHAMCLLRYAAGLCSTFV